MSLEERRKKDEEIENALSPGKLKILRVLISNPKQAFTRYELGKRTPVSPADIRRDLEFLVKIGWVKVLPYQPTKYLINLENEKVRHLAEFLGKVGYLLETPGESIL
ncbi:MAG: hypothetical protein QW638_01300 [Candidatus Bathyarchaeia archaeon]|nr:hypothetical protein [Candidatus Bathyarchaeota archaeon]